MNAFPNDQLLIKDSKLDKRLRSDGRLPMGAFVEAWIDGRIEAEGDLAEILAGRAHLLDPGLAREHLNYVATRLLPEIGIHTRSIDKRLVQDHYDRGDDFFEAFLGPRMLYTSAYYDTPEATLEEAQDRKLEHVCRKLHMAEGQSHLDLGCGWGTLPQYAAQHYGVSSLGVTLSENQTAFGNARIAAAGLSDKARLECMDYRDLSGQRFQRISCLEMSEHVGSVKYQGFMQQVRDMLTDDGLFFMQIVGPRRGSRKTNPAWGLFMAKYIFPGADASRPFSWVADHMERAGLELHSVENINYHYGLTIRAWYRNWLAHEDEITGKYGVRWFRLWQVFLAWAQHVGLEGESTAMQIVAHRAENGFDRSIFLGERERLGA